MEYQNKSATDSRDTASRLLCEAIRIFPKFSTMLQDMCCEWSMGRWGTIFQPSVDPRELHRQWNLADRPDIAWPEGSEREGAVWRLISWCVETGLLPNVEVWHRLPAAPLRNRVKGCNQEGHSDSGRVAGCPPPPCSHLVVDVRRPGGER